MKQHLDSKWSKQVRERDNGRCVFGLPDCHGKANQAHHVFSRQYETLRYDIRNGLSCCIKCHDWIEINSIQGRKLCQSIIPENDWQILIDVMLTKYNVRVKNDKS